MAHERYNLENLKRAIWNPRLLYREYQRATDRIHKSIHSKYYMLKNGDKNMFDFMNGDWDNLFILDACRADLFIETADIETFDEYRTVFSPGSNTTMWSAWHFAEDNYGDVVYVTANPVVSRATPNSFHELVEVWHDPEAYDIEVCSIPPEPVSEATRRAYEKHPDKRIVAHFVQPHIPFITKPDLIHRTEWADAQAVIPGSFDVDGEDTYFNLWNAYRAGDVSKEEVWEGYRENLEVALDSVLKLADDIPGKTVITSDHGNHVGERLITGRKAYGHKGDFFAHHLNEVPWAVLDDERRDIVDGAVQSRSEGPGDRMENRLQDLGYMA